MLGKKRRNMSSSSEDSSAGGHKARPSSESSNDSLSAGFRKKSLIAPGNQMQTKNFENNSINNQFVDECKSPLLPTTPFRLKQKLSDSFKKQGDVSATLKQGETLHKR